MNIECLADKLSFTECPRWRDGRLWFSDFYTNTVRSVDNAGNCRVELTLDDQPAGIGWTPDGELRVVSQTRKALVGYDGSRTYDVADLSKFAPGNCNDMVMTSAGNAYIGNFGFDFHAPEFCPKATNLIFVSASGDVSVAADELFFPNGSVVFESSSTQEPDTLVVAESMGYCLTAFSIGPDGALFNRRPWAGLGKARGQTIENFELGTTPTEAITPDGIAADNNGGIWVATLTNKLIRVVEGGERTHTITFDQLTIACAVGDDGSLYVCTTSHLTPETCLENRSACVYRVVL